MEKEMAKEILLRMSPLLAIVNYGCLLVFIYILVTSYKSGELSQGLILCLWVAIVRYVLVLILRWRISKKFEGLENQE